MHLTARSSFAVRAFPWSSGGYLENFDMWHLSGIFRSVWLYSVPEVRIDDVTDVTIEVRGTLVDPAGRPAATLTAPVTVEAGGGAAALSVTVIDPAQWTDETPNAYTLVLELLDAAAQRERRAASSTRPVLMGEWLHAMGNSLGRYEDMWQTIRAVGRRPGVPLH